MSRKRWMAGLIIFLFFTALGSYLSHRHNAFYTAESTVRLLPEAVPSPVAFLTQAKVVTSRPVLEEVKRQLDKSNESMTPSRPVTVLFLQQALQIQPQPDSWMIRIVARHENPETAVRLANAVAETYQAMNLQKVKEQYAIEIRNLEDQIAIAKKKLENKEEEIIPVQERAAGERSAAELRGRLSELEKDRTRLLQTYTDRHPDVVRLDAELEALRGKLEIQSQKDALAQKLRREAADFEGDYRRLSERVEQLRLKSAEETGFVRILAQATVPAGSSGWTRRFLLFGGMIVGVLFGTTILIWPRPKSQPAE